MATVLVVDDEPLVLSLLERVLRNSGFDVVEAGSGPEALEIARARNGKIDVMLTDLNMPGMSGQELTARVKTEMPDLPVIYMSGYCDRAGAGLDALDGSIAFLQKPFNQTSLLAALFNVVPEYDICARVVTA